MEWYKEWTTSQTPWDSELLLPTCQQPKSHHLQHQLPPAPRLSKPFQLPK